MGRYKLKDRHEFSPIEMGFVNPRSCLWWDSEWLNAGHRILPRRRGRSTTVSLDHASLQKWIVTVHLTNPNVVSYDDEESGASKQFCGEDMPLKWPRDLWEGLPSCDVLYQVLVLRAQGISLVARSRHKACVWLHDGVVLFLLSLFSMPSLDH